MVNENAWIILFYKFKLECFLWDKINITLFSGPQVFQVWNYFRNKIGFDGWVRPLAGQVYYLSSSV